MIAAALLLIIAVVYRVVLGVAGSAHFDWLHNFSPFAAIALCGAIYLPRRIALALPLGALFVSDLILNAHYHIALINVAMLPQYLALGVIAALGLALRRNPSLARVLGGSVASSIIFYVVTNTGAWFFEPRYARTVAGWTQALTTGLPGFPPTLFFFRHTLISDVVFTLLFVGCMALQARRAPAQEAVASA